MDEVAQRREGGGPGGAEAVIRNPVLRGSQPDPSIVRAGEDYFIATSTFEWFPGVQIHHSRDLIHWRLRTRALTRKSQLDLEGNPRSGGIWAPCLSYCDGLFYLVYTDVKTWGRPFTDAQNYLVTATSIDGPWSEPIALHARGFDASLFHDDDGRKWLLSMLWDHRPGHADFGGILLQEYSSTLQRLVGESRVIFSGSGHGTAESPHVYKHNGLYYLMVAEGGTGWEHQVCVARASHIAGPYELDPASPLLTSRFDATLALQKAGHACLVETQNGHLYIAHLCARPLGSARRCTLGRETALQKVHWTPQGWLRLAEPGNSPKVLVTGPGLAPAPFAPEPDRIHFSIAELCVHLQTLRSVPDESWLSLKERPGYLRLRGRESLQSLHRQSVVARRLQAHNARFATQLEFHPTSFQQMAGLMCLYDDQNFYYAAITHEEQLGRCLRVFTCLGDKLNDALETPLPLPALGPVDLQAVFKQESLTFFVRWQGVEWQALGPALDATALADETPTLGWGFTGTFVALCAHDMTGSSAAADFAYFDYVEDPDRATP